LLIEHPFADRKWVLAKELESRWFLLCTTEGQVLARFTRASSESSNNEFSAKTAIVY
jgi:hypothetical protein